MYNLTKQKFIKFPESNKSMIYLMWIYSFGQIIAGLFISIYIFKINNDISSVIIFNIIMFISCFIGFSGIGHIYSLLKKNIKSMYYLSYFILILSFSILFFVKGNINGIYLFGLLYGLGFGSFWCVVHANELTNIKDKNRDFYSSLISAGGNILQVITPLIVSIIFLVGNNINIDGYQILFILIPIIYLISFLFIKNIGDYTPTITTEKDIKNFYNLKKYKWGQLYIFFSGSTFAMRLVIIPIIAILLLKSEINIGFFESLMGVFSFIIVIFMSHIRNKGNRLKILGIISFLIFLAYLFFAIYFNVFGYILFSLLLIVLLSLYRVSEHVYDLKIMDSIKNKNSDFFPSMLLREFTINFARVFVLLISLFLTNFYGNNLEVLLRILLIFSGIMYLLTWFSIKMHVLYENHDNIKNLH